MSYGPLSFAVATTLSAQRIVQISAANTVAHATASGAIIGITTDAPRDTTSAVPVAVSGIAKLFMNDTVAAGGLVTSDASGRGVPFTAATASAGYVGRCLDTVSATGTIARILVQPGAASSE